MVTRVSGDTVVRRGKDVMFSRLDDELLAIDAEAGYCYSMNETAGLVWDLLASAMTVDAVCARLREEFSVDAGTCAREVTALLESLVDAGLVKVDVVGVG